MLAHLELPALIVGAVYLTEVVVRIKTDHQFLMLLGLSYVVYCGLMVGWLWRLSRPEVLLLTAATAAVMALQVALIGWADDWFSAISLMVLLPATTIGAGLLIARTRREEPAPEQETTPGLLLRSKWRRNPRPARKKVPLTPPASPWDHLWDG